MIGDESVSCFLHDRRIEARRQAIEHAPHGVAHVLGRGVEITRTG